MVKLPYVLKDKVLLKAGWMNGSFYPFDEIAKCVATLNSPPKTVEEKNRNSIFWSHGAKDPSGWVGDVRSCRASSKDETLRGDVYIADGKAAQALEYQKSRGWTSWGISPDMLVNEKDKKVFDIEIKRFSLSLLPAGGEQLMLGKEGGEKDMEIFGEGYEFKLGSYGHPDFKGPSTEYGYPKSQFGYYPSVQRLSETYFLLDKLITEEKDEKPKAMLQEIKGILKHWTGQAYPHPKTYPYPKAKEASENEGQIALSDGDYAIPGKSRMKEITFLIDKLIAGEKDAKAKAMLQEVKALLSRMGGGDYPYPKIYPYPKSVAGAKTGDGFLTEAVTVDWIEEDEQKPFKFIGKALKVEGKTKNGRWYGRKLVEQAFAESRGLLEKGGRLTVMAGHPKKDATDPSRVVGKVEFGEIGDDDWMPYEAELANTSLGLDMQKLLRGSFIGDVSLRSRGTTAMEKVGAETLENVKTLHFRGLDLVIEGAVPGAGVENILNAHDRGGEFDMGTTLQELKKERPDLVEAIRTEEKEKLHQDTEKLKEKLHKDTEKLKKELKETKEKLEAATKEGGDNKQLKDLSDKVQNLGAEIKLRDSKELALSKIQASELKEELTEDLLEQMLGKKPEEMDKVIEARIELVKKVQKSEPIGLSEKEKDKDKDHSGEVREAFGGEKKEKKD